MILDRTSRKVLNLLAYTEPNMENGYFSVDYAGDQCGISENDAYRCIFYLERMDYVEVTRITWPGHSEPSVWGVKASHRGLHHREVAFLEGVETICKSVLLPVIVAIITALLIT